MIETKMVMDQKRIHDEFCEWAKTAKDHDMKTMLVKCRHVFMDIDDSMPGDEVDQKLHERLHAEPFDGEESILRIILGRTPLRFVAHVEHITDDSDVRIPVGYSVSMYPDEVSKIMWFVLEIMLNDPRTFG